VKKHTWARSIRNGIMTVVADSPSWCQQLSLLRMNYIKEINEKLAQEIIKEIRFKSGSVKAGNNYQKKQENFYKIDLTTGEKAKIKQQSIRIKDQELSSAYERFLEFVKKLEKKRELEGWIRCEKCGRQIPQNEKYCLTCSKNEIKNQELLVEQFLYEIPWISYEQMSRLIPSLEKDQFDLIKRNLIKKVREKLDYQMNLKENKEQIRFLAYFLTMLISGESPSDLNKEKVEKILKISSTKIS
jgi:hypothetical protein